MDYAKLSAKAKVLIEKNGFGMTFTREARTPADSDKPWNGPSTDPMAASPVVTYAGVKAVRDEIEYGDTPQIGQRVPLKTTLYVAEASFPSGHIDLKTLDRVNDGTINWKICYAVPISPGDTEIIYMMGLEG